MVKKIAKYWGNFWQCFAEDLSKILIPASKVFKKFL